MQLECLRTFGNFKPGDKVTVPDGCIYDEVFFAVATSNSDESDAPAADLPAPKYGGK